MCLSLASHTLQDTPDIAHQIKHQKNMPEPCRICQSARVYADRRKRRSPGQGVAPTIKPLQPIMKMHIQPDHKPDKTLMTPGCVTAAAAAFEKPKDKLRQQRISRDHGQASSDGVIRSSYTTRSMVYVRKPTRFGWMLTVLMQARAFWTLYVSRRWLLGKR